MGPSRITLYELIEELENQKNKFRNVNVIQNIQDKIEAIKQKIEAPRD